MLKFFRKDIDRNFFKDFAEKINFSGIYLKAVISEEEYRKIYQSRNQSDAGLYKKGILISLKKRDLPLEIQVGEIVSVNSEEFRVIESKYHFDIVKLYLEQIGE